MIQEVEHSTIVLLTVLFLVTQIPFSLAFIVHWYFLSRPIDWVDMNEKIEEPESQWPYIVLFYPVLRELEATMRTTFVSLAKLDYPAERYRVVAIPNADDRETIASLRRLTAEFSFLQILEIPATTDPTWQTVWDAWDANPKAYWWHYGKR
ncbi:MAG: glycosyl transferase, partial [Candidatus Eremiobacteraeota bacterium]|nr:glycosyl transferase [Candidatus Eremiobacteraeota bacterium]